MRNTKRTRADWERLVAENRRLIAEVERWADLLDDETGLMTQDVIAEMRAAVKQGSPATGLRADITDAINRNSAENGSNTPDFILAGFILQCLQAFDTAVNTRAGGPVSDTGEEEE